MLIRPYTEAARRYRRAGWVGVIPIGYRPGRKNPPLKGYTGWAGADPSDADVQTWIDGTEGAWNIGLHLPHGIVVPDVDAYNGGDATLAKLVDQVGQPLPPTWSSTSKGEHSPSRHRFYRAALPDGRVWRDHPGGDRSGIDALHVGHRYAVVWPSIHPSGDSYLWYDPDGDLYEDVPEPSWMTVLDDAWITVLSKPGEPLAGAAADDSTSREALDHMRPARGGVNGRPCYRVAKVFGAELRRIEAAKDRTSAGGLHNPGQLYALAALGMEGHAGVRVALSRHQTAYVDARMRYRDESEQFADADWWRMFRGAVGKWLTAFGGVYVEHCDCDGPAYASPGEVLAAAEMPAAPARTAQDGPERPAAGVRVAEVADPDTAATGDVGNVGGDGPDWSDLDSATPGDVVPYGDADEKPDPGADDPEADTDPEAAFWTARKVLRHIRQSALAGYASPWATLGVVLARVVAATPPVVQLPAIVGGHASLNLFAALVGRSGAGKGAAERVARTCVEIDGRRSGAMTDFPTHALGSGEGLAHMFMKRAKPSKGDPDPEPHLYNLAAVVTIAEIDTFAALQGRQGSTLGGQLRQAAMGEQLGFFYVDKEKRMLVPEHAYRLCLLAGVQPKRAQVLLDESAGGTPQRFMWLPAELQDGQLPAAEDMPEVPEPLLWTAPAWPVAQVLRGGARTELELPAAAWEETVRLRRAHIQGQGDPLDGHANLTRLKVAAALAILDGRVKVDDADWGLSAVVMARSDATRQHIVDELATERREQNTTAAEAEARKTIIVSGRVESDARLRVSRLVATRLAKVEAGEWLTSGALSRAVGRYREDLDAVLDGMTESGVVEREEYEYHGAPAAKYRLTSR